MQATIPVMNVACATAVLSIFTWQCGTVTSYVRGRSMESVNREDGLMMQFFNRIFFLPVKDLGVLTDSVERDALVNRWIRIGNNNTANIPIALLVFFVAAQLETLDAAYLVSLVWVFVVARFVHTALYAAAIQPFRTVSYAISSISMAIAAISILVT
jgi:uncharacterized membrane protein YecN with MAPEG domain